MFALLIDTLANRRVWIAALTALAVAGSLFGLGLSFLETDRLAQRMKLVASERERIRARERQKLGERAREGKLRPTPKSYMKQIVEKYSLSKWLGADEVKLKLAMAGFRGPQAEIAFLFFRLVTPIAALGATGLYLFLFLPPTLSVLSRLAILIAAAYLGLKAPEIFLANAIAKRQASMKRAFPDALDLLLICVEAGMSIEQGFRRVALEIGAQSAALAEEFALVTAELSYLLDRRSAYENFSRRTGLEAAKNIATSLIQAEKYGTPLGSALRVVAQEARDQRMMEAEKKAASLPPKLTVPMILFFLPVLFAIILTPAAIQISGHMH